MRELFNAVRYVIRYGIAWRDIPNDFPPWSAVYQQGQRWLAAGCFEALAQDLRALLRVAAGRPEEPTTAIGGYHGGGNLTSGCEAARGETRLCSAAKVLGRGKILRLGHVLPKAGQGL